MVVTNHSQGIVSTWLIAFGRNFFLFVLGIQRQFPSSGKTSFPNFVALMFYLKSYVIVFDMKCIPHLKFNSVGKGPTIASYHNFDIFDTS